MTHQPPLTTHSDFVASLAYLPQGHPVLAYRRINTTASPTLILLHGLLDHSAGFAPLVAALEHTSALAADVIALDWRGHGASMATPGDYWFPRYLADLDRVITQLAPDGPVVLVGHSMGGQVASLYAGLRTQSIAGLVTLDSLNVPDTPPDKAPTRYRQWLDTPMTAAAGPLRRYASADHFIKRLEKRYPELDRSIHEYLAFHWLIADSRGGYRLHADPAHRSPMPYGFRASEAMAIWQQVQCPVLCLDAGGPGRLQLISPEAQAARHACFPRLECYRIPDCGHMLHLQKPGVIARHLDSFIQALA